MTGSWNVVLAAVIQDGLGVGTSYSPSLSRLSVTHVEDEDSVCGLYHPSCSLLMEFVSITQDMSVMMVQKMEVRISMIIAWP